MEKFFLACAALVFFVACSVLPMNRPTFEITTTKADDQVTLVWQDGAAYFDVHSPSGIGAARMLLMQGDMPKKIGLRLHLKGIELLKFSFAQNQISVSISSHDNNTITETARVNGATNELELTSTSEFWMPTEIISQNKTIPLQDGYFQVELPRAFYASGAREFSIEWIDFYR